MKTFFLGLNKYLANKYCATYSPVIFIKPYKKNCPHIKKSFKSLKSSTHIILTSKHAAKLFIKRASSICKISPKMLNKKFLFLTIGKETSQILNNYNIHSYKIAPFPTAEGIIFLLKNLSPSKHKIFYPHSTKSRYVILSYLQKNNFSFVNCLLYNTYYKKKIFPKENSQFIFTSPSTVNSFFKYNIISNYNTYIPIGPITKIALEKNFL